jgi:hypothetical protein
MPHGVRVHAGPWGAAMSAAMGMQHGARMCTYLSQLPVQHSE